MGEKNIAWGVLSFIVSYQIVVLVGLPFYIIYAPLHLSTFIAAFILFVLTGLGITAGYHRFYAHRAYKLSKPAEAALLLFGTMSVESSALSWSFNHRNHHAHTDKADDPYSVKKGFMHAHMFWLFHHSREIEQHIVSDLYKNRMVMWQHRNYYWLAIATNLGVCVALGFIFRDMLGAIFIAGLVRIFVLHHVTWFINSLAHTWGAKTFSREESAVDNYAIAIATFGEGYHNYHHVFPSDYRNGIKWYHFDPGKWLIWTLSKVGLATGLRHADEHIVKRKMIQEDKHLLLEHVRTFAADKQQGFEERIHEITTRISENLVTMRTLMHERRAAVAKEQRRATKARIKALRQTIHNDWRAWQQLTRAVMNTA